LRGLPELLNHTRIASKVFLNPYKDDGEAGTEMHDLRDPLDSSYYYHPEKLELVTHLLLDVIE
jgi:hypothetical protein